MTNLFTFEMTSAAALALTKLIAGMEDIREPVLTLVRDSREVDKWQWGVGVYEKTNLMLPNTLISNVSGFEFYFDPSVQKDLNGCVLDFVDGHFKVLYKQA